MRKYAVLNLYRGVMPGLGVSVDVSDAKMRYLRAPARFGLDDLSDVGTFHFWHSLPGGWERESPVDGRELFVRDEEDDDE